MPVGFDTSHQLRNIDLKKDKALNLAQKEMLNQEEMAKDYYHDTILPAEEAVKQKNKWKPWINMGTSILMQIVLNSLLPGSGAAVFGKGLDFAKKAKDATDMAKVGWQAADLARSAAIGAGGLWAGTKAGDVIADSKWSYDMPGYVAPAISTAVSQNPYMDVGDLSQLESFILGEESRVQGQEKMISDADRKGVEDLTVLDYLIAMNPLKQTLKGTDMYKSIMDKIPGFMQKNYLN